MGKPTTSLMLGFALLLLITNSLTKGAFTAIIEPRPAGTEYRPAEHRNVTAVVDGRRVLAPFQLCLDCRCCAANDTSNCSTMPCCFGIDCNLPDKPFGVCAFVPKTCNCTSCQFLFGGHNH